MTIRPEKTEDIPAIRIVIERAFSRPVESDLVDALRRNGKATFSLVAEDDGCVVGHILFSPVAIQSKETDGIDETELTGVGLAPLAVIPERQSQRIGSMLVEHGLKLCRDDGHRFVVVLGHPDYYPRFGFVPASRFNIKSEFNVADEVFMAMELKKGSLQNQSGIVKYQPEFNEF